MNRIDPTALLALAIDAGKPGTHEHEIFLEVEDLMIEHAPPQMAEAFRSANHIRGTESGARIFFETLLPSYGVLSGHFPNNGRGMCRVWREGDPDSRIYEGCTPALAVVIATLRELAMKLNAETLANCERCKGHGYVTAINGQRVMCRHTQLAAE